MKRRGRQKKTVDIQKKAKGKYLFRKKVFAGLFLTTLYIYTAVNAFYGFEEWKEEAAEELTDEIVLEQMPKMIQNLVKELDESIIESMYGRMNFIETYSYIQVLLDKREYNNFSYIKDEDGYLHYASFFREDTDDVAAYAKRVLRLQNVAKEKGADVIFCITPGKYLRGQTNFRTGMPVNDPNDLVDELLFYLNRYGVETLDYRKYFPNEQTTLQDAFFRTDHHWTVPAAFEATCILERTMSEQFGVQLDPQGYLESDRYERVTYRHGMMGSMGRRTGANFCDLENFEALWPNYEVHCTRESMNNNGDISYSEGLIQETIMDGDTLLREGSIYANAQYALYLNTISPYEKIVNADNPEGIRLLMIRDSYFSPAIVFLTPVCSEIEAVWVLEEVDDLDIEQIVRESEYDYIVLEIYPYNINDEAFNYFKEHGQ